MNIYNKILIFIFFLYFPFCFVRADDASCEVTVEIEIINSDNVVIPDISFEIYEQTAKASVNKNFLGSRVASGKSSKDLTKVLTKFKKTSSSQYYYAIKIWEKNKDYGDFWFYDENISVCNGTVKFTKKLSAINVVIRNGYGDLKTKQKFSIYTQNYDVDANKIPLNLVSDYETSSQGYAKVYLAPKDEYYSNKNGVYIINVDNKNNKNKNFLKYDINALAGQSITKEFILSSLAVKFEDGQKNVLKKKKISFYEQDINKLTGDLELSTKIVDTSESDANGYVYFEYPSGNYAISLKDDLDQDFIFYDNLIIGDKNIKKTITLNSVKIKINDDVVDDFTKKKFDVYSTTQSENKYLKNKKIKSFNLLADASASLILRPGNYFVVYEKDKNNVLEKLITIKEDSKFQELILGVDLSVKENKEETKKEVVNDKKNNNIEKRKNLFGYILLQVEKNGEAWYINPTDEKKYYLKNGNSAYNLMKKFSIGINNAELEKIPVGVIRNKNKKDSDNDGICDDDEKAIGTNINSSDSDNDSYDDYNEIINGFDPLDKGKKIVDKKLTERLMGRILLQVENNGEAWYLNPIDNKRYFMKDGNSAFEIMRSLGLGISNVNFEKIN